MDIPRGRKSRRVSQVAVPASCRCELAGLRRGWLEAVAQVQREAVQLDVPVADGDAVDRDVVHRDFHQAVEDLAEEASLGLVRFWSQKRELALDETPNQAFLEEMTHKISHSLGLPEPLHKKILSMLPSSG